MKNTKTILIVSIIIAVIIGMIGYYIDTIIPSFEFLGIHIMNVPLLTIPEVITFLCGVIFVILMDKILNGR